MQASQVAESSEVSQSSAKAARNLRAVFAVILACAWALIVGALIDPARADTYARPTLYQTIGGSNCTDVIVEPLPSSTATAQNCLNDYYPKTILLPCSWWWYETDTQSWPPGASSATLWIK